MKALPAIFYRDPEESLDRLRRMREVAERQAERERRHKRLRIRALVADVMRRGGGGHGR